MNKKTPEIKNIFSPDIDQVKLPEVPNNCAILIEIDIGLKGEEGADIFYFTAITPKAIAEHPEKRWGRGYLIMPIFSWGEIKKSLENLLMHCSGEDWNEISSKLSKELHWEYENYQE